MLAATRATFSSQENELAGTPRPGLRRDLTVPVPGLSPAHDGLRVVHLSDLHVGWATSTRHVRRAIDVANAARPDLIVMTGDYVCLSRFDVPRMKEMISHLLAAPVVATLGNHDFWAGADRVAGALREAGCVVLRNAHHVVELRGAPLYVAGVDDPVGGADDADATFAGIPPDARPIALVHCARAAAALVKRGAGLVLSGHNHGGQVDLPHVTDFIGRRMGIGHMRGLHRIGNSTLFVSAGVGNSVLPFRVGHGAQAEVAVLTLRAA